MTEIELLIKIPKEKYNMIKNKTYCAIYDVEVYEAIANGTLQPKIGRWIIVDDCEQFIAKCSECGRIEDSRMISNYPYCHCGAKMQEVEE